MREIKFRAWAPERKYFLNICEDPDYMFMPTGENHSLVLWDSGKERPSAILSQYTGLKDKNGVEIYEGDICRAIRGEQEKPHTRYEIKSKVIWFRGGFEIFDKPMRDFYTDDKGRLKDCSWCWHGHNNLPDIFEEIIEVEVIGNRFQNPELLK